MLDISGGWAWGCLSLEGPVGYVRLDRLERGRLMRIAIFIDGAAGTTGLEIPTGWPGAAEFALVVLDDARRKDPRPGPRRSTTPISRSCACPTTPRARRWR